VIEKLLPELEVSDFLAMATPLLENFTEVARNPYGSHVLQRVLEGVHHHLEVTTSVFDHGKDMSAAYIRRLLF
jgi:hypothetical protein